MTSKPANCKQRQERIRKFSMRLPIRPKEAKILLVLANWDEDEAKVILQEENWDDIYAAYHLINARRILKEYGQES